MKNLKIYTDEVDELAQKQIAKLLEQPAFAQAKVRIMPDVHAGKGCVIGFTADLGDKVIPNIVGVDIGCGMYTVKLGNVDFETYFRNYPDADGYFGRYGGVFVEEKLKKAMAEITEAYFTICKSRKFIAELRRIRKEFQGRPTPVTHLERLSDALGGRVQLYAKREDLNHSGAHKLNHCMGEALLAHYMGKKKVIAETGAGQHGVAMATAAAYFGLECDIYMGSVDIAKQAPNVARMKILGANVVEVTHGLQTLKEAVDAAFAAYAEDGTGAVGTMGRLSVTALAEDKLPMDELHALVDEIYGSSTRILPASVVVAEFSAVSGDENITITPITAGCDTMQSLKSADIMPVKELQRGKILLLNSL